MVRGSTMRYGSSLRKRTLNPRACNSAPSAAEANPLPSEETTPPVMKTYRAMGLDHTPKRGRVGSPKQRFGALGAGVKFGIYAIATAGPAALKARLALAE